MLKMCEGKLPYCRNDFIRQLAKNHSYREIARCFNLKKSIIHYIVTGRAQKQRTAEYNRIEYMRKIAKEQAAIDNVPVSDMYERYQVPYKRAKT
jgi:hypothetical protein